MLHRSRNSGRVFWWNQLPCRPVLTPISCTKLTINSAHAESPIVPKQVFFLLCWQFGMCDQSMLHRSRNSGRDFWWNQLPCGPVLTPISCTKFKIHSEYEDSPIVPKQVFFSCACNLECGTSQCFTDQETQKEIFGETSFLVGQFLHPSPVQSSRSIQCIQTAQLVMFSYKTCISERSLYSLTTIGCLCNQTEQYSQNDVNLLCLDETSSTVDSSSGETQTCKILLLFHCNRL